MWSQKTILCRKTGKKYAKPIFKVANAMQDLLRLYPTDLITHTKPMYEKFIELNTTFAKEIISKGVAII